jgi:hypothetical protein
MKGVIKTLCSNADIVDLTHGISAQDVMQGAIAWQTAWKFFPPGSIHVGVVDPGVGTSRLAIAAEIGEAVFICPNNGLLTYILEDQVPSRIVSIENPEYRLAATSRTFHGRDVFAPAAAHVAAGVDIDRLGLRIDGLVRLPLTKPVVSTDSVIAQIVYFDVFGNAYTDLNEGEFTAWGAPDVTITVVGTRVIGPVDSYGSVAAGDPVALFASHGRLEIAVRNGSARSRLGIKVGDAVQIDRTSVNS